MKFQPLPTEPVHLLAPGPQARLGKGLIQLNVALYRQMGKPTHLSIDTDLKQGALQFGDTRRAFHQLLRVHGPNRTVGSKRVLGLGFEPGYYTLREVTKSGAYILVREDLPTPTAYTWERLSVVSKSYSKRPPELALYTRRPVGALSQLLRAELNFSMAFMVEVSPQTQELRLRAATFDDEKPIRVQEGRTALFGATRLLAAGLTPGRYGLVETVTEGKYTWYVLKLTEEL
jgi:hypothetical protein